MNALHLTNARRVLVRVYVCVTCMHACLSVYVLLKYKLCFNPLVVRRTHTHTPRVLYNCSLSRALHTVPTQQQQQQQQQ